MRSTLHAVYNVFLLAKQVKILYRLHNVNYVQNIQEEVTIMYDYDLDYVQLTCRISAEDRRSLSHYYADLPETVRIEAHKIQTDLARQNRIKFIKGKAPEFYYAMLLLALRAMKQIETGQQKKIQLTAQEAQRITEIRLSRIKAGRKGKGNPTRRLVEIRYFEMISKLRKENLSWRDISAYIAKFHKHRISHSYLRKVFLNKRKQEIANELSES